MCEIRFDMNLGKISAKFAGLGTRIGGNVSSNTAGD
jgi:hypothetical protein